MNKNSANGAIHETQYWEEAMSKEMMICPKAKDGSCPDGIYCSVGKPHELDIDCGYSGSVCPACIPYIPEQPKEPVEPHLCSTCRNNFPTCKANKIVWGIDRNPEARGAEADKVLECDAYIPDVEPACPECGGSLDIDHNSAECHVCLRLWPLSYFNLPMTDLQPAELTLDTLREACSKMLVVDDSHFSNWLEAHDSVVAAKAVREFAEKVCNILVEEIVFCDFNDLVNVQAHIRAMAGKE
jgi:hypothetical protein